jgi:hypothetical protein
MLDPEMAESGIEGIEDVVEELLALPPERFTEARNAAAKRLRSEGKRQEADAVKSLPRPSIALWALNKLAREDASLLDAYLEAAGELRDATRNGGDIRAATAPERAAEGQVTKTAAALVRGEGKGVTDAVERSMSQTLRAAAADPDVADALRHGLLAREPEAPSIDDVLGYLSAMAPVKQPAPAGQGPARQEPGKKEPDRGEERRALKAQIAAATADAAAARTDERAADDAAREARAQWQRAEKHAEKLKGRTEAAEDRLADLRTQLDEV